MTEMTCCNVLLKKETEGRTDRQTSKEYARWLQSGVHIYRMLKLDDFNKINLLCSVAKLVFDVYISVISAAA